MSRNPRRASSEGASRGASVQEELLHLPGDPRGLLLPRAAEEAGVDPVNRRRVAVERGEQRRCVRETHRPRQAGEILLPLGEDVGLPLPVRLDSVLETAEEVVGGRKPIPLLFRHDPHPRQGGNRLHRAAPPELRLLSAVDQLVRLGEELDLADPPEAQLYVPVVSPGPRRREVDPVLHPLDLLDRGEVEVLAVDEGDDGPEELLPEGEVPRHRERLDERRALPGLPP